MVIDPMNRVESRTSILGYMSMNYSRHPRILLWYGGTFFLVFCMICLGGLTRLTQSGLSIVEWKPITGILPPLNTQAWLGEFAKYQTSPEYLTINYGMSLHDFKFIYLMEYAHRLLGRLIGLVFLIPLIAFWGKLPRFYKKLSIKILIVGALQGIMGWYMVKSGLKDIPHVSPFRLTAHLCLALFILALLIKGILNTLNISSVPHPKKKLVRIAAGFIFLTIIYGGFVAGHKAGLIYNTYPLMGREWIPGEWLDITPLWHNFLINAATVQWMHRLLALLSLIHVILFYVKDKGFHASLWLGLIMTQFALGILTLIYQVPVVMGVIHQGMGALLFSWTMVMIYTYDMINFDKNEHSAH